MFVLNDNLYAAAYPSASICLYGFPAKHCTALAGRSPHREPGRFSQPPSIRRKNIPLIQRRPCAFWGGCACRRSGGVDGVELTAVDRSGLAVDDCSVASIDRRTPSKRSLQAPLVRPSVSTPMVVRLTRVKNPVISHGKFQRLRSIGGRYSGRSRSIRPPNHVQTAGAAPLRKRLTRAGAVSAHGSCRPHWMPRRRGRDHVRRTVALGEF